MVLDSQIPQANGNKIKVSEPPPTNPASNKTGETQPSNLQTTFIVNGETGRQIPKSKTPISTELKVIKASQKGDMIVEIDDLDEEEEVENRPHISTIQWPALILAVVFKTLHVIFYFLSPHLWKKKGKTFKLLFTIILGALDFWIMKNVCGRKLVGLIWKRKENHPGEERHEWTEWVFGCRTNEQKNNRHNTMVFWGSMVIGLLFWGLVGVYNLITFSFEVE